MENNNEVTLGLGNTIQTSLAHEQLARDEQFVGVFIATILVNINKEKYNITPEKFAFIEYYKDTELYLSHVLFAKKIIDTPAFREFMEYISLLLTNSEKHNQSPLDYLMNSFKKGDKGFLIRQIFRHSSQVLEKYRFLNDYTTVEVQEIDMDSLSKAMWQLPVEQKVLCVSYIFSKIQDEHLNEKATIAEIIKKQESAQNLPVSQVESPEELSLNRFFNAFYIQYLLHKDFANSNTNVLRLQFLQPYLDDPIYASQRVFIKNLIGHPEFKVICEELKTYFQEYNETKAASPCAIFLNRINKERLLKQVFISNAYNDKYKFLPMFLATANNSIDLDALYNKMWHLSQEQQIVIFAYIFSSIEDGKNDKVKLLKDSFTENCKKVKEYNEKMERGSQIESDNLDFFINIMNAMIKNKT